MKRIRMAKVDSSNGELHYVFEESPLDTSKLAQNLTEAKIKEITKKEASKPLFIARQE